MMPDNGDLDTPGPVPVENMIGKIREIRPPHDFAEGWETPGIRERFADRRQQVVEETIRKWKPCLALVVVGNLPNIPDGEAMVYHLHADRPKALRNSS